MTESKRVVLITGAAGGIGRACIDLFTRNNWRVIGVDMIDFGTGFPADGLFVKADISQAQEMERIFQQAAKFSPMLHAVVNVAAYQVAKPLIQTTLEEWQQVMDTNLRPIFLSAKLGFELMKAAGEAAIVNVSSVHAVATSADIAAYAASKGGVMALTRAMAIEFAPHNIRVNAILPGAIDTPMLRAGLSRGHVSGGTVEERMADLARKTVNGRIGKPGEIASSIYFLADDNQSSFMTGQALIVDGGATCRLSTE